MSINRLLIKFIFCFLLILLLILIFHPIYAKTYKPFYVEKVTTIKICNINQYEKEWLNLQPKLKRFDYNITNQNEILKILKKQTIIIYFIFINFLVHAIQDITIIIHHH